MPGTLTSRLGLYKPAASGVDNVNVVTDINNNADALDGAVGFVPCTSGTRPATPFLGMAIRESDTGKAYICSATASPGPVAWKQVLAEGGNFDASITMPAVTQQIRIGGTPTASAFGVQRALAADLAFATRISGDAANRLDIQSGGVIDFGDGTVLDCNFYRSAANTLKTDDNFIVNLGLTVVGASNLADTNVSGNLNIGSARYRNALSTATTVANTASETLLAGLTIPANDAAVGAVYRIKAWGTAAVAAATTPSITFRTRIGGAGGAQLAAFGAITVRSGMTDGSWSSEIYVAVTLTGVSGTWAPNSEARHNFVTSATTYTNIGPIAAAPVIRDTTASQVLCLTVQWGTASTSNTITCQGVSAERVA